MIHRVDGEGWSRIGMAIAALGRAGRNMRRRRLSRGHNVVVAKHAIRIGWPMRVGRAGKRVGA